MDKNKKELENLRHSAAHLLAAAVVELWPKALPTIGPVIETGFYYDFDFGGESISESDLASIEERMRKILKSWKSFEKVEIPFEEAKKMYRDNPYKLELLEELKGQKGDITFWESGKFLDLCRGGHIEEVNKLKHFKLLSIAGAYWKGDEKNTMLTRIYGTAFFTKEELEEFLAAKEESLEFDHRKIGKELELFFFSDMVGKGLPLISEKGTAIKRELERFIVDEEIKRGYKHVSTPPLAKTELYKTSGHYPYYKDTMYPVMKVDEDELILRPMTCPHHFMLFKARPKSYKDLPYKMAEIAPQFRYEKSGELTGLIRLRMFLLADAHIFATPQQAQKEIEEVLELIDYVNEVIGMEKGKDYRYRLSLGDRKNTTKYYKDDKAWDEAEDVLRSVLKKLKSPYFEAEDEAAFYGPKIDVQVKKASGKEESAFTVQYDFVMPKRFDLNYTDASGGKKQVVVIHRSSLGCFERTMAFLIEKYHGAMPVWLSPVQAIVLPISQKHAAYAQKVLAALNEAAVRAEADTDDSTLPAKIRRAQLGKIPFMLVVGDREAKASSVSVRKRDGKDLGEMKLDKAIETILEKIRLKELN